MDGRAMKPTPIIFDLFGTLVGHLDFSSYGAVLARMADVLGVPVEAFSQVWRSDMSGRMSGANGGTTADDIARACLSLGVTPAPERVSEACAIRVEFTAVCLEPASGALTTLATIKANGHPTALISDCTAEVPTLWPTTPFAPLIDFPVFSCAEGITKPDRRIYLRACERLAARPEDCLYVGDGSSRELTGAGEIGMRAILVRGPELDFAGTDRSDALGWRGESISTISDVLPILAALE